MITKREGRIKQGDDNGITVTYKSERILLRYCFTIATTTHGALAL
jgi:hypothetical protein